MSAARQSILTPSTATIPLTRGKVAIVDVEDFEKLSHFKWYAHKGRNGNFYAYRRASHNGRMISMHGAVSGPGLVDHKDRDGLNNRRENLRPCTNSQNCANAVRPKRSKSKYRGVYPSNGKTSTWKVSITYKNKQLHLGCYSSRIEAAKIYDNAALGLFGEFAVTNFPETRKLRS